MWHDIGPTSMLVVLYTSVHGVHFIAWYLAMYVNIHAASVKYDISACLLSIHSHECT